MSIFSEKMNNACSGLNIRKLQYLQFMFLVHHPLSSRRIKLQIISRMNK